MSHFLVDAMAAITPLSDIEKRDIEQAFEIKTFEKGAFLIREGQIWNNAYQVISGCAREYMLVDDEEKTTAFYTENDSIANFTSLTQRSPSTSNVMCIEPTKVAILNTEKEKALYAKHPRFEKICREGTEQMMGTKQDQLAELITLKPEKRYEKLQKERPDLLNRVPQYHIASFLGITPEALSRIRKRLVSKPS